MLIIACLPPHQHRFGSRRFSRWNWLEDDDGEQQSKIDAGPTDVALKERPRSSYRSSGLSPLYTAVLCLSQSDM